MHIPDNSVISIFKERVSPLLMKELDGDSSDIGGFKSAEVYWLNTPGPIYTTYTDNCGTGQIEAMRNVGGDEDYHEFIFKQPKNRKELSEVIIAAQVDPLQAYYIDGNEFWTNHKIIEWWSKIEKLINYMVERYDEELKLPSNPHNSIWDIGGKHETLHLFGPSSPLPQNYKAGLDFYQYHLKSYLEWYMQYNNGTSQKLVSLKYNWNRKEELDKKLEAFNPQEKDIVKEYKNPEAFKNAEKFTSTGKIKKEGFWSKFKKWRTQIR